MEFSLHRQLKERYARHGAQLEAPVGKYRIDVLRRGEVVEIQHGSLAAIRTKVVELSDAHRVRVVKPLVMRKQIVRLDRRGGRVVGQRLSPKRGQLWELFHELIYFRQAFPRPKVTIDVPLVEIEEWRYPGHGRRRRRRASDFQIEDQRLLHCQRTLQLRGGQDLWKLLDVRLPEPFHSGHLAEQLQVPRWIAQRIAYCLRHMEAAHTVGKRGNTRLYSPLSKPGTAKRRERFRKIGA